jgi:predicted GIY-YIG superfamily endonuclease
MTTSRRDDQEKELPRDSAVYIMANKRHGTLYTGVTSNLSRSVYEHREGLIPGFTTRYGCKRLVYYERYERIVDAIAREKQIKSGSRAKKLELIESVNPEWSGLYEGLA